MGLLSESRGPLKDHMQVSIRDGEEHLHYTGNLMMEFATRLIARWLNGYEGRSDLEPAEELAVIMITKKGYWVAEHSKAYEKELEELKKSLPMAETTSGCMNFLAQEIRIYDLGRESDQLKPLMLIRRRTGADELLRLDCSLDEAVGLLLTLKRLHLGYVDDIYSRDLFNNIQQKKTPPVEKKPKKPNFATKPEEPPMSDALYRKLQNFRLQSLL